MKNNIMENYPCKDCKIFEDTDKCNRHCKVGEVVYPGCKDWKEWFSPSWKEIKVMFGVENEED